MSPYLVTELQILMTNTALVNTKLTCAPRANKGEVGSHLQPSLASAREWLLLNFMILTSKLLHR